MARLLKTKPDSKIRTWKQENGRKKISSQIKLVRMVKILKTRPDSKIRTRKQENGLKKISSQFKLVRMAQPLKTTPDSKIRTRKRKIGRKIISSQFKLVRIARLLKTRPDSKIQTRKRKNGMKKISLHIKLVRMVKILKTRPDSKIRTRNRKIGRKIISSQFKFVRIVRLLKTRPDSKIRTRKPNNGRKKMSSQFKLVRMAPQPLKTNNGPDSDMIDYYRMDNNDEKSNDHDSSTIRYMKMDNVYSKSRRSLFEGRIMRWLRDYIIDNLQGESVMICIAPGHEAKADNKSSFMYKLVNDFVRTNRDLKLESDCDLLIRHKTIQKQSTAGRNRYVQTHRDSIRVNADEEDFSKLNKDKVIIILDDIRTSGCTLRGCEEKVRTTGPKDVKLLAIGKTVYEKYL